MRVFISHSSSDKKLASYIANNLRSCGIAVWLDQLEIRVGDSIPMKISDGIRDSDYVLLLISNNSLQSKWVEREWLPALYLEINNDGTIVLPALVDDCNVPTILADKRFADFRGSYIVGLSELVKVFEPQLLAEFNDMLSASLDRGNVKKLLEDIYEICDSENSYRTRTLLQMLVLANNPIDQTFPEWLEGNWHSRLGWNENQILKCTKTSHLVCSNIAYGSAIGSFKTLRDGVIRGAKECSDGIAIFVWHQEIGGDMGGARWDEGWGFLWRCSETMVKSLWWYKNVSSELETDNPKNTVYQWILERASNTMSEEEQTN